MLFVKSAIGDRYDGDRMEVMVVVFDGKFNDVLPAVVVIAEISTIDCWLTSSIFLNKLNAPFLMQ